MTQNYALITTSLFSLFSISCVTNVASSYHIKFKSAKATFALVVMLLDGLTTSQKAVVHNISNRFFKAQDSFTNHYLAYASSHGIGGGGGGGGHGGFHTGNIRGHDTFQVFSSLYN
jgi:hypothetical protein